MVNFAGLKFNLLSIIIASLFIAGILILVAWIVLPDLILAGEKNPTLESLPAASTPVASGQASMNDSIQAISLVAERAINSSVAVVDTMNDFITVLVSIALAAIGASALRLKQSSDEIRGVQMKFEDIHRKYEDLQGTLEKSREEISLLSTRYLNMQQELVAMPQKILPFEMAVIALRKNEISMEVFEESRAWFSWQKWVFSGNDTGYEELLHHKINSNGLPVSIRLSAIIELDKVEAKCRTPGAATAKDFNYREKLLKLLNIEQEAKGNA